MKKLYKEYTITSGGGTFTFKVNSLNDYYLINGGAVTLTSGLTITIDSATKNNVVRIYWLQDVTIGAGGSITILGNNVPINIIGGIMFTCVYNGTTWDIFQIPAEEYDAATLKLENVVYVNPSVKTNDTTKRVFKTYDAATSYISSIGTATTNNHWTIKLSSGYLDEDITLRAFMDVQGTVGTKIKSVTSNVSFVSSNVYDSVVYDCAIVTAYVAAAKTANFVRCTFERITSVFGAEAGKLLITDSIIKSADFSNSESIYDWSGNKFYATGGNILMSGMTHNIKDSEVVAYGANNISLPDSLINCFISIPTIITTRATSIAGGKVVATTINAGADLNLLNTDIGAANLTMATATNLVRNATKSSGIIILEGTATKSELGASWNGGTVNANGGTAWNNGGANGVGATAWNSGGANGADSTAWDGAIVNGNSSTGGMDSRIEGERAFGVGLGVVINSFAEFGFGNYNTNGAPTSDTTWELTDKLFSIGNGTSDIARSDALVVFKSGKMKLQNILNCTPLTALPDVGDSEMGDIAVLDDGTIHFFNGTNWGSFDITV